MFDNGFLCRILFFSLYLWLFSFLLCSFHELLQFGPPVFAVRSGLFPKVSCPRCQENFDVNVHKLSTQTNCNFWSLDSRHRASDAQQNVGVSSCLRCRRRHCFCSSLLFRSLSSRLTDHAPGLRFALPLPRLFSEFYRGCGDGESIILSHSQADVDRVVCNTCQ